MKIGNIQNMQGHRKEDMQIKFCTLGENRKVGIYADWRKYGDKDNWGKEGKYGKFGNYGKQVN